MMRVEALGIFLRRFWAMPHPMTPIPMNPYVAFGIDPSVVAEGDIVNELTGAFKEILEYSTK